MILQVGNCKSQHLSNIYLQYLLRSMEFWDLMDCIFLRCKNWWITATSAVAPWRSSAPSGESKLVKERRKDVWKSCFDVPDNILGGGFKIFFYFHPYLRKWFNLTNIFQMGWFNHQPGKTSSEKFTSPSDRGPWAFAHCWGKPKKTDGNLGVTKHFQVLKMEESENLYKLYR